MKTRTPINRLWFRLMIGFLGPLILVVAAAGVAFVSLQRLASSLANEKSSHELLAKAYALKESLYAMAAAKRAHHLTGKKELIAAFDRSQVDFTEALRFLKERSAGERKQTDRLARVEKWSQDWFDNASPSFGLWKKRPKLFIEWAKEIEQTNLDEGIHLLTLIGSDVDELIRIEQTQLGDRRRAVYEKTDQAYWTIGIAVVVSISLSVLVILLLSRGILRPVHRLGRAVDDMRKGNFGAVTPQGPTELAELISGFNVMGIALSERTVILETRELRYRTVVGKTSHLLWTSDANGRNRDMSTWCAFTGQHVDDLNEDGWLKAVHPEDRNYFAARWSAARNHNAYTEDEIRLRRADGSYRSFAWKSVPVLDEGEQVSEWVHVCADITERKMEEKLRHEKEAAMAANRAKSEFLAKMSHELRTPLNAVIGMSNMLATQRFGDLNAKQLDYITDITEAGKHLLGLINDILDLSKVEAGRMELTPELIPLADTIDDIVSSVRTLAEGKQLELVSELPVRDIMVVADLGRFKQIMYNLISNAVKFTPPGGRVMVRCRWIAEVCRDTAFVRHSGATAFRIDVEDTGIGIAQDDHSKIGREFFQAGCDRAGHENGTGLGLALTQHMVQLMKGEFWFTSEVNKGSTFSIALPIRSLA